MSPFLARRQYNTPILYVGVQRIACTNIEAAPKRPWKNDLSLRGNLSLHGKTILPPSRPISQHIIFSLFRGGRGTTPRVCDRAAAFPEPDSEDFYCSTDPQLP